MSEPAGSAAVAPAPSAPTDPAVAVEAVVRRYGDRVALANVTATLESGHTLAVFGSNGAGKSTLLRVLGTLLRPHSGRVEVLGAELPREAWRVRGRIGYVGHEPLLYRELSARENLVFQARILGVATERPAELLAAVGLERRAGDPVRELSRGMVQRLAIARALLADPPLLLLDEPRAHLDPQAAELVEPLIGRASGKTRVLVSHDVEGALAESDAALGLRAGAQIFAGAVSAEQVRELYR